MVSLSLYVTIFDSVERVGPVGVCRVWWDDADAPKANTRNSTLSCSIYCSFPNDRILTATTPRGLAVTP